MIKIVAPALIALTLAGCQTDGLDNGALGNAAAIACALSPVAEIWIDDARAADRAARTSDAVCAAYLTSQRIGE